MKQAGVGYNDNLHYIFKGALSLVLKYCRIMKDYQNDHPKYYLLTFMLTEYLFLSPVFIAMWELLKEFANIIQKPKNLKEEPWDDRDFVLLAYNFTQLVEPFYMAYQLKLFNENLGYCRPIDGWPLCFLESEKQYRKFSIKKRIKRFNKTLEPAFIHYQLVNENDEKLTKKYYMEKANSHFSILFK